MFHRCCFLESVLLPLLLLTGSIKLSLFTAVSAQQRQGGGGTGGNSRFNANAPVPGPDAPVLAGYDLVEYHNLQADQDGVLGMESISHRLHTNGYLYYFSTVANRELFIQNPEKYLPKYGGFCAWGMAWEYETDGWPWQADHMGPPCGPSDGWAILEDGRLYCSIYRHYQNDFNSKRQEGIRLADERWMEFYGSLDKGPQNNGCYAWNWQECFARSIHTSVDNNNQGATTTNNGTAGTTTPTTSTGTSGGDGGGGSGYNDDGTLTPPPPPSFKVSQVFGNEPISATWSDPVSATVLTFQWTFMEGPELSAPPDETAVAASQSSTTGTVVLSENGQESIPQEQEERSPQIVIELSATDILSGEYIAFGVAEQLMQGPLVACFVTMDDEERSDGSNSDIIGIVGTYNVTSTCRTMFGNGMGMSILNKADAQEQLLNVQILSSTRNATHYTVRLAMHALGLFRNNDPRQSSRVIVCKGKVSGDGSPQPHANNGWNRQAVTGIDWLSVLDGYNKTTTTTDVNNNKEDAPPTPLPPRESWIPITGSDGHVSVLNDRVRVVHQLFRHFSGKTEIESKDNVQEIVEIQLQNVEFSTEGYGDDDNMDSYIGFAFATDTMSGLVITCSIGAGVDDDDDARESVCKQWQGQGTNLYPILPQTSNDGNTGRAGGGWFVRNVVGNSTHANFTLAGRVADVVQATAQQQQQQEQQGSYYISPDTNLRAIITIGRSPLDTRNPLQHFPQDREAFQLDGLAAGTGTGTALSFSSSALSSRPSTSIMVISAAVVVFSFLL